MDLKKCPKCGAMRPGDEQLCAMCPAPQTEEANRKGAQMSEADDLKAQLDQKQGALENAEMLLSEDDQRIEELTEELIAERKKDAENPKG